MTLKFISSVFGSIRMEIPQKFIRRVRFMLSMFTSAPYEKSISAMRKQIDLFSKGLQSVFSVRREKQ